MMQDGTRFFKSSARYVDKNVHKRHCPLKHYGNQPYTLTERKYDSREGDYWDTKVEIKFCPGCGAKLVKPKLIKPKPLTKKQKKKLAADFKKLRELLTKASHEWGGT